jgi:hypothetical protein
VITEWLLREDVTDMDTGTPTGQPISVRRSLLRRLRAARPSMNQFEQQLTTLTEQMLTEDPTRRPSSSVMLSLLEKLVAQLESHLQEQQQSPTQQRRTTRTNVAVAEDNGQFNCNNNTAAAAAVVKHQPVAVRHGEACNMM